VTELELVERQPVPHALQVAPTLTPALHPLQLLQVALEKGADPELMGKLMLLAEHYEANEARKQSADAFATFKAKEVVEIVKDKHVCFRTAKGDTSYDHATIGNVVKTLTAALGRYGFAHSWATRQEGGRISVTCTLKHKSGHVEAEATLNAAPDDSGGKNSIQAIGSATSYLQRYTLLLVTGCATMDQPDDDGADTTGKTDIADLLVALGRTKTSDEARTYWDKAKAELKDDLVARNALKVALIKHLAAIGAAQ